MVGDFTFYLVFYFALPIIALSIVAILYTWTEGKRNKRRGPFVLLRILDNLIEGKNIALATNKYLSLVELGSSLVPALAAGVVENLRNNWNQQPAHVLITIEDESDNQPLQGISGANRFGDGLCIKCHVKTASIKVYSGSATTAPRGSPGYLIQNMILFNNHQITEDSSSFNEVECGLGQTP